jgi:hypothetical protein
LGTISSMITSSKPTQKKMNARVGSNSPWRNAAPGESRRSVTSAPAVDSSRVRPSASSTARPSTRVSRSRSDKAIRSITSPSRAASALTLVASRTNASARSALRSRCSAIARIEATASSVTLAVSTAPETPTGVAAPTFVPGAIAATGQASRMNAPADAARAPAGET